jgi:hypothetical protein
MLSSLAGALALSPLMKLLERIAANFRAAARRRRCERRKFVTNAKLPVFPVSYSRSRHLRVVRAEIPSSRGTDNTDSPSSSLVTSSRRRNGVSRAV